MYSLPGAIDLISYQSLILWYFKPHFFCFSIIIHITARTLLKKELKQNIAKSLKMISDRTVLISPKTEDIDHNTPAPW